MKKPVLLLAFLAALACGFALTASADSDTVTATVSVQMVSVNVSTAGNAALDYGTQPLSATNVSPNSGAPLDVKNTGNVAEDFKIRGYDTEGWSLNSTPGVNQYVHQFTVNHSSIAWASLSTSYVDIAPALTFPSGIAPNGLINVELRMSLPTNSTATGTQNAQVQVMATAH